MEILKSLKIDELPEPTFSDYQTIQLVNGEIQADGIILINLQFWNRYKLEREMQILTLRFCLYFIVQSHV